MTNLSHPTLSSVLGTALLLASPDPAFARDLYRIDPTHSQVGFRVRHLVTRVPGEFRVFEGTLEVDGQDLSRSSVAVTIQAASVDTRLEARDNHLRSADFFDAERHPLITFRSTRVVDRGQGRLEVTGDLTIKGITRPVTLAAMSLGAVRTPFKDTRAGFEGTVKVNRKDFGMNWNLPLDLGGTVLGEEVEISLAVEAIKQEAP
ncbi:YceI family protein [Geothrix sp. 21YS21S-2]|uniref:YceI family protein n=1 Tax=Geothrix sp. 21YS21S-2 TaxID=3068893 RepID=UPI0027BAB0BF|nr:YceI family protein [Geothrix sp. 21YS21S-2]